MKKLDQDIQRKLVLAAAAIAIVLGLVFTTVSAIEIVLELVFEAPVRATMSRYGLTPTIEFKHLSIDLWRQSIGLASVQLKVPRDKGPPLTLSIERVRAGRLDWASLIQMIASRKPMIPHKFWLGFEGLDLNEAWFDTAGSRETFDKLDIHHLEISGEIRLLLDPERKQIGFYDGELELRDLAKIEVSLSLSQFTFPPLQDLTKNLRNRDWLMNQGNLLRSTRLDHFWLRYRDDSLMPRLDRFLESTGEPPLRGFVSMVIDAQATPIGGPLGNGNASGATSSSVATATGFVGDALQQLWNFTEHPHTLVVEAKPPKPVDVQRILEDESITDFQTLANLMGLKLKAD